MAILAVLVLDVGIPDTKSFEIGGTGILTTETRDTVYVIEIGYEHEMWYERDTVEAKAVPRRSGSLWYVPLIDGRDVWCDRMRQLSKRGR